MSRKSVIQLVPAPISRGNASDLRYRLLMAALGSSEEVNPLLVAPEDAAKGGDDVPETVAASVADANQAIPPGDPPAVESLAVAEHEDQAVPITLVRPPAPSPAAPHETETGGVPVPRPAKRR